MKRRTLNGIKRFYAEMKKGDVWHWIVLICLVTIIGYMPSKFFFAESDNQVHGVIAGIPVGLAIGILAVVAGQIKKVVTMVFIYCMVYSMVVPSLAWRFLGILQYESYCFYHIAILFGCVGAYLTWPIWLGKKRYT